MTFRAFIWLFMLQASINLQADPVKLPDLGDSASSVVSLQQEYQTGQSWMRAFYRQAKVADDPLLYDYLHDLVQRLAVHSQLEEKRFNLLVVDSKAFNAFAVPGNVVGINTGLFHYAETEDQLAAVIGHELAHLSQRHYARSLDRQKNQSIATLAGLLGSLLILASGDAEAGIAAVTATQAAAIDNQLKYSRIQEQEADRIGMQTLANAGMNPEAVAHMFQHMLVVTRYRTDIRQYDFLLTHPLSDTRVADAFNQARDYTRIPDQDSFNFHLMKARVILKDSQNPKTAIALFRRESEDSKYTKASEYGLALALLADGQLQEAAKLIDQLYNEAPHQLAFAIAKVELLAAQGKLEEALALGQQHLALSPTNYPLSVLTAKLLQEANQPAQAAQVLRRLVASGQPDTPNVWYALAETEGLAGNILQVYLARAEYYIRIGAFPQAQKNLHLAEPLLQGDMQALSRLQMRLRSIEQLQQMQQF